MTDEEADRYIAVLGPNSKQLWIYDEKEGVFIDPPAAVLDEIEATTDDLEEQERLLIKAAIEASRSDDNWLIETEYWYDGDI